MFLRFKSKIKIFKHNTKQMNFDFLSTTENHTHFQASLEKMNRNTSSLSEN